MYSINTSTFMIPPSNDLGVQSFSINVKVTPYKRMLMQNHNCDFITRVQRVRLRLDIKIFL